MKFNTFKMTQIFLAGAITHGACAQVVHQDYKVVPVDGGIGQEFGCAVEIDQGLMVIGARGDATQGNDAGAAYIYDANSGALVSKLLAEDGASNDLFGASVAIRNGIVVVGAPNDTHNGISSGSVYLFDAISGNQLHKLVSSDASDADMFGSSVAVDNGIVVIGAIGDDDLGDMSGSTYLFDSNDGEQINKLLPDVGNANMAFGISVAISGGTVGVGSRSYFTPGDGFTISGVYLFEAQSGAQQRVLRASNGVWTDFFGEDIDIDNGTVVVGAWARSIFFDHSGAAYVFNAETGHELHYIFPGDGHDRDNFGVSVAIDDGLVTIGAHQDGDSGFNAGSAYLYDALSGSFISKFLASDGAEFDFLGTSVAIDSSVVAIGAIGDEDNGGDSGSVYIFGSSVSPCPADLTGDGELDFFDVSAFLNAYNAMDPIADFTGDGMYNFFDVSAFLNAFNAGCP